MALNDVEKGQVINGLETIQNTVAQLVQVLKSNVAKAATPTYSSTYSAPKPPAAPKVGQANIRNGNTLHVQFGGKGSYLKGDAQVSDLYANAIRGLICGGSSNIGTSFAGSATKYARATVSQYSGSQYRVVFPELANQAFFVTLN